MTAEQLFKQYRNNQEKLKELQYRLASIDDVIIQTTKYSHTKVQTTQKNHIDERVYNREQLKARLEWDIFDTELKINRVEMAMKSIEEMGMHYNIRSLKLRYLGQMTYTAIAEAIGTTPGKLKGIMTRTEELFCYLAR